VHGCAGTAINAHSNENYNTIHIALTAHRNKIIKDIIIRTDLYNRLVPGHCYDENLNDLILR